MASGTGTSTIANDFSTGKSPFFAGSQLTKTKERKRRKDIL
jgi:hypothetical protein